MLNFVSIEPANFCQLHCPQCPVGNATCVSSEGEEREPIKKQCLSLAHAKQILHALPRSVRVVQFYFQGEPLLNPDLPQMIALAHQQHRHTIVSTNAQALTAEMAERLVAAGLNKIIVSMDGWTQETYSAYRAGGSVEKVKEGIRYLHTANQRSRHKTYIALQCLRLASNQKEWQIFEQQYRSIGADSITFKTAQFYHYEHGDPLMPESRYARYIKGNDGLFHPRPTLSMRVQRWLGVRPCVRVLTGCIIAVNGDVLPCCYDKEHLHVLGNIFTEPWETISAHRAAFIRTIWRGNTPPMCNNCTS